AREARASGWCWICDRDGSAAVGWAKAPALHFSTAMTRVRRAHQRYQFRSRDQWWARRTTGIAAQKGSANAFAHPTRRDRRSLVQQRDRLVVRRLRDGLQISVDIRKVLVRQHRFAIGRHLPIGGSHEIGQGLVGQRIRRELWAGIAALPHGAVTLEAAV